MQPVLMPEVLCDDGSVGEPDDGGHDELQTIIQMGEQRPVRRHPQRSWQGMERARGAKAQKRTAGALQAEEAKRRRCETVVEMVATSMPLVSRTLGLPARAPRAMTEVRAGFMLRLALGPPARGDLSVRRVQGRALHLSFKAIQHAQNGYVERVLTPSPSADSPPEQPQRILVLSWQWDESSQRTRSISLGNLDGEKMRHAKLVVQIMVQLGSLSVFEVDRNNRCSLTDRQPLVCRPLCLQACNADTLLHGMQRQLPVWFAPADMSRLRDIAESCNLLVLAWVCDRAASNYLALEWVAKQLEQDDVPSNILFWVEPCAPHGVSLVKNRPKNGKALVTASGSLGGLMRQWRFSAGLRDSILTFVRCRLEVRFEARPPASLRLASESSECCSEIPTTSCM